MKHTFAKKALFLGAISILFSIAPVQAMDVAGAPSVAAGAPMDPALQQEVQTKAGFFASWNREALRKKLDENMKFLDNKWNNLMKCLKGEGCTRGQIAVITGTLATILAIITVLTGAAVYRFGPEGARTWMRRKSEALGEFGVKERPWFGKATTTLQEKVVTPAGEFTETYVTEPIGRRAITPAGERLRAARAWARTQAGRLPVIGQRFVPTEPTTVPLPPAGEEGF